MAALQCRSMRYLTIIGKATSDGTPASDPGSAHFRFTSHRK